jgi:glycosyltransferase involved in cell wall biosynthesis
VRTDLDGESTLKSDPEAPIVASPIALRFLPERGTVPLARRPVPEVAGRRVRVVHVPEGTRRIQLEVSPWLDSVTASFVELRKLSPMVAASMMSADVAASGVAGSTDRGSLSEDLRAAHAKGGMRDALQQIAVAYEHLQHRRAGDSVDYASWRVRNAVIFDDDAERLRTRIDEHFGGSPPLISIVMPVYAPSERWLTSAIDSMRAQVYENWQLCIVDDASPGTSIRRLLYDAAASDKRIRVGFREENGHIAAATNDALDLATGEFVGFMDHDDELAPYALAVVALSSDDADILYTDEDKVDATGRHFDPHCKPPWNPELLLGQNYMSHLTVMRRSLVESVGRLRAGFDGSQDHDLLLRATAETPSDRIVHVPYVAYHWRAIAGSTAHAADEKSYTEDASTRALVDRLGHGWEVGPAAAPTAYRCTPPLVDFPLVSIIIPTRDGIDLLRQCTESLARTTYPAFEIIIVDNDSTDPDTLRWLDAFDNGHDHRVLRHPGAFNFSAVNNAAARAANGELLCLLNNDTEVIEPGWLNEMVRWIQQPEIGVVGAKLLYPNDTVQHAGVVLGLGGLAGHGHHELGRDEFGYFSRLTLTHEVGAVTGACLLTRRAIWDELGGLDEELAVAFNDIDYCLRVRHDAGQRILWTPHALLYHHESVSRGAEDDPVKVARFNAEVDRVMDRWADRLAEDPAYSPNLSLDADSFTLARAPRLTPPWQDETE